MGARAVAPAPSVCAGLQQALLQGWRAAFPLQSTPWPAMAAAVGASSRELLARAQQLHRVGQLLPVQVRWGEALRRQRWRLSFSMLKPEADEALRLRAAQLPSALCIESVEGGGEVWLHLEAREASALARARLQLEASAGQAARACWVLRPPLAHCTCVGQGGPCDDWRLAQLLEAQGLPIVAHPFAELARQLGDRSERALLARLREWQRCGGLQRLSLSPPFVPSPQRWRSWVLPDELPGALPPGCRAHHWTDAASGDSGWWLSMAGDATPPLLPAAPLASWVSRVLRLRPQTRLFTEAVD